MPTSGNITFGFLYAVSPYANRGQLTRLTGHVRCLFPTDSGLARSAPLAIYLTGPRRQTIAGNQASVSHYIIPARWPATTLTVAR